MVMPPAIAEGFMAAVAAWPEEWAGPRNAQAQQWREAALKLLRALAAAGCRLGILTRNDHALAKLTLEAIARYPLITYDDAFTGRGQINKAFLGRGLKPKVVLTAIGE